MPPPADILAALHWQYPQAAAVVIPLAVGLSALTVWTYVPQVRRTGRRWAWVLPGLRVAAVVTLAVSLMRPAVTRPRTPGERGPVVILVDDSRSMSVTDTGRPAGERVAVAAALGKLPAGSRDASTVAFEADAERLSAVTDDVARARSEVEYARLAGRGDDVAAAGLATAEAAVHRAARAASADAAAAGLVSTPQLDRALAYLSAVPVGVDADVWLDHVGDRARTAAAEAGRARVAADGRLYDDDPAVHDAADAVADQPRERLAWAAAADLTARLGPGVPAVVYAVGDRATPMADADHPTPADGTASDLAGGIRTVLVHLAGTAAVDDDPPRAVVLLSDGRQVGGEPAESVAAVAPGVPVLTVAVASPTPSPNVAVTDLFVPQVAHVGEGVVCRATVRAVGLNGASTGVRFSAGGDEQDRRVAFADDRPVTVPFTWVPRAAGVTQASVRATPLPDEATDADNVQRRWTRVLSTPTRVAVLTTVDGPAFEAAVSALSHAPSVELSAAVLPAAATSPAVRMLGRADVAVLVGVAPRSLTAAQWEAVVRLVTDRGGGVVLVGGAGGFGSNVPPTSPLAKLLPFAGTLPTWVARPLHGLRPTAEADAPHLSADPADDRQRWADLPAVDGVLPLANLRPDVRPLIEGGDGTVVAAERRVGPGRSICLGTDGLSEWRGHDGDDLDRFWLALVRAAGGPPYAVTSAGVSLDADAFAIGPGQPLRVRARAEPDAAVRLTVRRADGTTVRVAALATQSGGRSEATVGGLPAGDYTVSAGTADGRSARVPLRVRPSYDAELADVSGDGGFLRRLADATGGRPFRLEQLDAVASRLATGPAEASGLVERSLWDGTPLVALVVGLLTAEWALRKRAGLA